MLEKVTNLDILTFYFSPTLFKWTYYTTIPTELKSFKNKILHKVSEFSFMSTFLNKGIVCSLFLIKD